MASGGKVEAEGTVPYDTLLYHKFRALPNGLARASSFVDSSTIFKTLAWIVEKIVDDFAMTKP